MKKILYLSFNDSLINGYKYLHGKLTDVTSTLQCEIVGTLFMQQHSPLPLRNVERYKCVAKDCAHHWPNIAWREGEGMKCLAIFELSHKV